MRKLRVVIASKVTVGKHMVLNRLEGIGHHSFLSDFVLLAPGAQVLGGCTIRKGSYIGTSSVILEGKRVGENSIVGAGSVETKDVPDNAVFFGNLARYVRLGKK